MRNDRDQWNNRDRYDREGSDRYRNQRNEWGDDNSEWRPAQYSGRNAGDNYNQSNYGQNRNYNSGYGASSGSYQQPDRYRQESGYGSYRSSYGAGNRYGQQSNFGGNENYGSDRYRRSSFGSGSYGHQESGYSGRNSGYSNAGYNRNYHQQPANDYYRANDYNQSRYQHDNDRDFWDKAGDEVASWFGDDEARRRREQDHRRDDAGNTYSSAASYRGKGPKNYKRSDDRIQEDVNDRLADDPHIDASDIEVAVSNGGEVILSGTVSSRMAKRHAEDLAERVSGVTNVENRIRIQNDTGSSWGNTTTNSANSATTTGNTASTGKHKNSL